MELHGLMRDFCRRTVTDIVNANFESGKKDKIVEKALQFFPSLGAVDQQVRPPSGHSFKRMGQRGEDVIIHLAMWAREVEAGTKHVHHTSRETVCSSRCKAFGSRPVPDRELSSI